jgi:O-antigen/teichoic acid export membrane protein
MATRRALGQAGFYALSIVATRAIGLFMVPYMTRRLTTAEYGSMELMATIADVATTVLSFGQIDALFRYAGAAADDAARRRVSAESFGLIVILAALAAITMQLLAVPIQYLLADKVPPLGLRFMLVTVALEGAIEVPLAWLRFCERSSLYLVIILGRTLLQAALVFVLLEQGQGVPGVMLASLIAAAVTATILAVTQWRDTGIRFSRASATALLSYGGPLVLAGLGGFVLGTFDRLLLAPAVSLTALAIYALAYKVAVLTPQLFQPFAMWWLPRRIQVLLEPGGVERSTRAVSFGLAFLYWLGFGVATGGVPLIKLMTPPDYHGAIAFLPWLVVATLVQHTADLVNVGSYAGHSTRNPMWINLGAAGVALIGYFLLIPPYGVAGAIAATILGWAARLVAIFIDSQRKVPLSLPWLRLGLYAGLLTLAAALTPRDLDLGSAIAACLVGAAVAAVLGNLLGLAPIPAGLLRRWRSGAVVPP